MQINKSTRSTNVIGGVWGDRPFHIKRFENLEIIIDSKHFNKMKFVVLINAYQIHIFCICRTFHDNMNATGTYSTELQRRGSLPYRERERSLRPHLNILNQLLFYAYFWVCTCWLQFPHFCCILDITETPCRFMAWTLGLSI